MASNKRKGADLTFPKSAGRFKKSFRPLEELGTVAKSPGQQTKHIDTGTPSDCASDLRFNEASLPKVNARAIEDHPPSASPVKKEDPDSDNLINTDKKQVSSHVIAANMSHFLPTTKQENGFILIEDSPSPRMIPRSPSTSTSEYQPNASPVEKKKHRKPAPVFSCTVGECGSISRTVTAHMLHSIGHNNKQPYFCTDCKTGFSKITRGCKGRKGMKCIDMNDFPRNCRVCDESVMSHQVYILHYFQLHLDCGVRESVEVPQNRGGSVTVSDGNARGNSVSFQSGPSNLGGQHLEDAWEIGHRMSPSQSSDRGGLPLGRERAQRAERYDNPPNEAPHTERHASSASQSKQYDAGAEGLRHSNRTHLPSDTLRHDSPEPRCEEQHDNLPARSRYSERSPAGIQQADLSGPTIPTGPRYPWPNESQAAERPSNEGPPIGPRYPWPNESQDAERPSNDGPPIELEVSNSTSWVPPSLPYRIFIGRFENSFSTDWIEDLLLKFEDRALFRQPNVNFCFMNFFRLKDATKMMSVVREGLEDRNMIPSCSVRWQREFHSAEEISWMNLHRYREELDDEERLVVVQRRRVARSNKWRVSQ